MRGGRSDQLLGKGAGESFQKSLLSRQEREQSKAFQEEKTADASLLWLTWPLPTCSILHLTFRGSGAVKMFMASPYFPRGFMPFYFSRKGGTVPFISHLYPVSDDS